MRGSTEEKKKGRGDGALTEEPKEEARGINGEEKEEPKEIMRGSTEEKKEGEG